MKTCPTCNGEGKVKYGIQDSAPAIRAVLLHGAKTAGRVGLVLLTLVGVPMAAIGMAHVAGWAIGLPAMTPNMNRDGLSPNEFLQVTTGLGCVAGVILSGIVGGALRWVR